MSILELPLAFSTYWLHAHGEGGGADFDLVMERDDDGLPTLRARHVAGLLRQALLRGQTWGWFDETSDEDVTGLLLGERGRSPVGETNGGPGCLIVSDARLSAPLRARLIKNPELIEGLFGRISSTAINRATGVPMRHHLRTVEAGMPMKLICPVAFDPFKRTIWAARRPDEKARINRAADSWKDWIKLAWPAFDEAGAKRTRGFGRLAWRELVA